MCFLKILLLTQDFHIDCAAAASRKLSNEAKLIKCLTPIFFLNSRRGKGGGGFPLVAKTFDFYILSPYLPIKEGTATPHPPHPPPCNQICKGENIKTLYRLFNLLIDVTRKLLNEASVYVCITVSLCERNCRKSWAVNAILSQISLS